MKFINTQSTNPLETELIRILTDALAHHDQVLWIIPGGSNISVVVAVHKQLATGDRDRIITMLSDERYGPVGHADSNEFLLSAAGFDVAQARFVSVLHGESLEETVAEYAKNVQRILSSKPYTIAFLGMGADGHTAGILPGSPAVDSTELVVGYDAGAFVRITLTPAALTRSDVFVVGAFGDEKRPALEHLRDRDMTLEKQPAQLVKQGREVFIFNDQIGEQR